jgi:hypothetical protein
MGIEPIFIHFGGAGMQNSQNKTSNTARTMQSRARATVIATHPHGSTPVYWTDVGQKDAGSS